MLNAFQTRQEFQRQLRCLIDASPVEDRRRLEKYIEPIPESVQPEVFRQNDPVPIGAILPDVLANIDERCRRYHNAR